MTSLASFPGKITVRASQIKSTFSAIALAGGRVWEAEKALWWLGGYHPEAKWEITILWPVRSVK
jgi:hypothetical protein